MLVVVGHGDSVGSTLIIWASSSNETSSTELMLHLQSSKLAAATSCCATHDGGWVLV